MPGTATRAPSATARRTETRSSPTRVATVASAPASAVRTHASAVRSTCRLAAPGDVHPATSTTATATATTTTPVASSGTV